MAVTTNIYGDKVTDYGARIDVISLDPSDEGAGTGSVSVTTTDTEDVLLTKGQELTVTDTSRGNIGGVISSINLSRNSASVAAETEMFKFTKDFSIPPFVGTLINSLTALCNRVGVNPAEVDFSGVPARSIVHPGYSGSAWVYLKQMMVREGIEVVPGEGAYKIVFRTIRSAGTISQLHTVFNEAVNDQNKERAVEIAYYNNQAMTNGRIYPYPNDRGNGQVFQVDAGETLVTEISVNGWLSSVNQPVCQNLVGPNPNVEGTNGVYCVAGSDGLGITAAQWLGQGGSVTVRITSDPSVLELTIKAPNNPVLGDRQAPYSIAATSGNLYSALHITGTGVRHQRATEEIITAASGVVPDQQVSTTVDNPFISSRTEAYNLGVRAAQSRASGQYTFSSDMAPHEEVSFSDVAGYRVRGKDAFFRVNSADYRRSDITFDGSIDTTFTDFNTAWAGQTFNQFNATMSGRTFDQFAIIPLRSS